MDREEGAITLTLCRLDRALSSSRDDQQRAAVKMRIAAVLRQIGLHEEASYLMQEARDLQGHRTKVKRTGVPRALTDWFTDGVRRISPH